MNHQHAVALTPAQPAPPTSPSVGHLFGALWSGLTSSPTTVTFTIVFALVFAVRILRAVAYPRRRRDPQRRFSRADKAEVLRRAGKRCRAPRPEHRPMSRDRQPRGRPRDPVEPQRPDHRQQRSSAL